MASNLLDRTTFPPVLVTNGITMDTTWYPQIQREAGQPDLGFYYPRIDYETSLLTVSNATLTLKGGVTMSSYGLLIFWIQNNGSVVSIGSPNRPNRLFLAQAAQELATNFNGYSASASRLITLSHTGAGSNSFSARFTTFSMQAGSGSLDFFSTADVTLKLRDCELYGGGLSFFMQSNNVVALTNNLFHRTYAYMPAYADSQTLYFMNNTYIGSGLTVEQYYPSNTWLFQNNSFDNTELVDFGNYPVTASYNGYINVDFSFYWPNTNVTDTIVSNFTYVSGPLGNWYQPTNSVFLNKGSTNANFLTLYHYTTTGAKETNSVVDLGYHRVATDSSGVPLDGDGDGIVDAEEDSDGDGIFDSGETDWGSYNSLFGVGAGPGLEVFTPLK